jgi:drug/metabolite transporter (DMT)-like permease
MVFKETKMNAILTIIVSVCLAVTGQTIMKKALNSMGNIDFSSGLISSYMRIFFSPLFLFGSLFSALSIFFWIYSLTKMDLSYAFPFLSLSFVLVTLISWIILGENVPLLRWIGVSVICIGVFLISRS